MIAQLVVFIPLGAKSTMLIPTCIFILFLFTISYLLGVYEAHTKRDSTKYRLPKIIKYILFLGTYNKYTLDIIVYQIVLVLMTILALVLGSSENYQIYTIFIIFFCFWLFTLLVIVAVLNIVEYIRHKEKYTELRKISLTIRKAFKSGNEEELIALKQRSAQLRDYLYNKKVERK